MSEQLTLLAAAIFGFLGAPWPAALVAGGLLAVLSSGRIRDLVRRYSQLGALRVFAVSIPTIAAHAMLFAALAFGLGRSIAFLLTV